MRRKSDAWLNATQILKVAGFDKPQRTRVLEREVQKGTHEKVQGGYGKYQGQSLALPSLDTLSRAALTEHPRPASSTRYLGPDRSRNRSRAPVWCGSIAPAHL